MTYIIGRVCIGILGFKLVKCVFKPKSIIETIEGNIRVLENEKI